MYYIFTAECKVDNDCPYDKACINENCLNPCAHDQNTQCGRGAECVVQLHKSKCFCPSGTQGNPLLACITGVCQYNEDCADHEACDRLNRVCRTVCDEDTCPDSATCLGRDHQPKCVCPSETYGNPYVECSSKKGPPIPQPACRMDSDCPSKMACINQICANPCSQNICSSSQECFVVDTLPLRTVMCQCPTDTVTDSFGNCKKIVQATPQCSFDSDCLNSERCADGRCIQVCHLDICGVNALCNANNHRAQCTCATGYIGNPHTECSPSKYFKFGKPSQINLTIFPCITNTKYFYDNFILF